MAVSLRLPEAVKRRMAKLAKQPELTPHGLVLGAIRENIQAEEARVAFQAVSHCMNTRRPSS